MRLFYEGYNDLGDHATGPDTSPIFRWSGYFPLLPVVMREKAQAMMNGGAVTAPPGEVRFDAGLATRAAAGALTAAADLTSGLTSNIGVLSPVPPNPAVDDECIPAWRRYCGSVRDAVSWALDRGKRVIFVTQPYVSDEHIQQQANVAAMLKARFGGNERFAHVNLGRAIDMRDRAIVYDGLHLVASGNDTIAANLVAPIMAASRWR